jgi:arsenite methyltransferase
MTDQEFHIEGGDLLSQEAIRSIVQETYGGVGPTDRRVAERFYSVEELASLPDETVRMALGVGNPVRHADLRRGQDILDLGSGGGIDCLLAARAVGPSGSVVGIDFLPDMVARATRAAAEAGQSNVRFVEGLIEALPVSDESVDVVISNGVVNLSPRKVRVLAEAFRVLRPGAWPSSTWSSSTTCHPRSRRTRLPGRAACPVRCRRSRSTRACAGLASATCRSRP